MAKNCRNCRHVREIQDSALVCEWEKNTLPPPVVRSRLWGKSSPYTEETFAEDCECFELDKGKAKLLRG